MGADLPTMAAAVLDGVIAVSGTLWFIAWLRDRWPSHGPLLGKAARASYATYVIHPLVLTAVMVAFASVPLAPEIKFLLVATVGVAACFTAGYALTRAPGISRCSDPASHQTGPRPRTAHEPPTNSPAGGAIEMQPDPGRPEPEDLPATARATEPLSAAPDSAGIRAKSAKNRVTLGNQCGDR